MEYKSHILLPECILKNFSQNGIVYYFDIINNVIRKSLQKNFNTENTYYDKKTEAFFSRNQETLLGRLHLKVKEYLFGTGKSFLKNREEVIRFLDSLYNTLTSNQIRKPFLFNSVNKLYDLKIKDHKEFVNSIKSEQKNQYKRIIFNKFKNYDIFFVKVISKFKLMIPNSFSFEFIDMDRKKYLALPLDPNFAILLVEKETIEINKNKVIIADNDLVNSLNIQAISNTYLYDNGIVVGSINDLKLYKELFK